MNKLVDQPSAAGYPLPPTRSVLLDIMSFEIQPGDDDPEWDYDRNAYNENWDTEPYVPPVIPGFRTPKLPDVPIPPREPPSKRALEIEEIKKLPNPWTRGDIKRIIMHGVDSSGCDIHTYKKNARIMHGHTAMWWAAKLGMWDEVLALLDKGADPNAVDEYDYTAMMWATRASRLDVVEKLLSLGADIDAMTKYGWTSFMWAKKCCKDDTAMRLLAMGAQEETAKPWEDGCPAKYSWNIRQNIEKKEAEAKAKKTIARELRKKREQGSTSAASNP